MEPWKTIEGYEGYYEVSNLGLVRNVRTGRILRQSSNGNGYLCVILYKQGKCKLFLVHRLVAKAYIPNPDNLSDVNHLNEDKCDNRITNLEWCTHSHNINYGTRNDKVAMANGKPVRCIETGVVFPSASDAGRWLGGNTLEPHISQCCNGKRNTAFGYHWQYVN